MTWQMRRPTVTIYVVVHDGVFVDVFASYSEASLNCPVESGWEIKRFTREVY